MTSTKGRACDGKQRHSSRQGAVDQIHSLARTRGANPARYEPYQCKHCGAWHIGHRAKRSST